MKRQQWDRGICVGGGGRGAADGRGRRVRDAAARTVGVGGGYFAAAIFRA